MTHTNKNKTHNTENRTHATKNKEVREQAREDVTKEEVKDKNKPEEKYDQGNEGELGRDRSKREVFEESVDSSQERVC